MEPRPRLPDEGRWFWLPELLEDAKRRGFDAEVLAFLLEIAPSIFRHGEQAVRDELAGMLPKRPTRRPRPPASPAPRGEPLVDLMFARATRATDGR